MPDVRLISMEAKSMNETEIKRWHCSVCSNELNIEKGNIYTVAKINRIFDLEEDWDAVDCAYCGCQNLLKRRYKSIVK